MNRNCPDAPTRFSPLARRLAAAALTAAGLVAAAAGPAVAAAGACYTREAFQAEQGIRLHNELMQVGLQCARYYPQDNLFGKYQQFTVRNRLDIQGWEKGLIAFYKTQNTGNPTARFDTFRTDVANEVSKRAALVTPTAYCQAKVPFAKEAASMTGADLRRFVEDADLHRLGTLPPCDPVKADLPEPMQVAEVLPYTAMQAAAPEPPVAEPPPVRKKGKGGAVKKATVKVKNKA